MTSEFICLTEGQHMTIGKRILIQTGIANQGKASTLQLFFIVAFTQELRKVTGKGYVSDTQFIPSDKLTVR